MERVGKICPVLRDWDIWQIRQAGWTLTLTLAGGVAGGLFTLVLDEGGRRTVLRHLLRPGALCLPRLEGNASVSGRGFGVLLYERGDTRTITLWVEHFRNREVLDLHLALTSGERAAVQGSGQMRLGNLIWDCALSTTTVERERVRGGRTIG